MTLTQLEYIVAVSETRSFFRAADRCHVTQPTLSQQIKKLEDLLNVVIFDRARKPIEVTPAGVAVVAQARRVLAEAASMKRLIEEGAAVTLTGDVNLAIIPTLAPFLLPRLVRELRESHPRLKLHIEELQTEAIVERLLSGALDVGIAATPLDENGLDEMPVFYEPIYLYFSADHPIGKKKSIHAHELNRNEVHVLADGHCFRDQALKLCRGQDRKKRKSDGDGQSLDFAGGSLHTLKEMVDTVGGYTLLPWFACHEYLSMRDQARVRPFNSPEPAREISVVSRAHDLKARPIGVMVEALKRSLPKELVELQAKKKSVLSIF